MILDRTTPGNYAIDIRLFSVDGREVAHYETAINEYFDLNINTKGLYILKVSNQKGQLIKSFKIQN